MLRIDAHQHFWKYDPVKDGWITEEMSAIRRDFLPGDLWPLLRAQKIDGCIAVQADQSETETEFLVDLAKNNPFIKAVVGWVDLQSESIEERLRYYSQTPLVKGFRHILQGEPDRALMLRPDFKRGIEALGKFDYSYDLLILPDQLPFAIDLVAAFPDQRFVIDHLAKPPINTGEIKDWKKNISAFNQFENVWCKVSGMVTEADWSKWKSEDFLLYMETALSVFGMKRLMFGSDWPVCLVAASYEKTYNIVAGYFAQLSKDEQELFFGGNAMEFYKLEK
jgi:L-fuconolactonase